VDAVVKDDADEADFVPPPPQAATTTRAKTEKTVTNITGLTRTGEREDTKVFMR
jgi:hypothetical protein